MTMQRIMWIFCGIGIAALLLALIGHFVLDWGNDGVGVWTGIGAGYLLAGVLMRLMPRWWRDHCDEEYARPAGRRYVRALWPLLIGYSLILFFSGWMLKRGIDSLALRALVALLPVLPLLLLIRIALRYLRETDELQRRIEIEAIGIASLLVSMLYFGGGLLVQAKVLSLNTGAVMIWVFPLIMLFYSIAKFFAVRRYR